MEIMNHVFHMFLHFRGRRCVDHLSVKQRSHNRKMKVWNNWLITEALNLSLSLNGGWLVLWIRRCMTDYDTAIMTQVSLFSHFIGENQGSGSLLRSSLGLLPFLETNPWRSFYTAISRGFSFIEVRCHDSFFNIYRAHSINFSYRSFRFRHICSNLSTCIS